MRLKMGVLLRRRSEAVPIKLTLRLHDYFKLNFAMKKLYIFLISLISISAAAQISSNGTTDGSITITPKGLQGSSNSTAGGNNLALGSNALKNNIVSAPNGTHNTAVGDSSLFSNTSGFQNTALGSLTLQNNTTGVTNTAIGNFVLRLNENGTHNTGTGNLALYYNTSGLRNTALGNSSLFNNTTANFNTAVGNWALFSNKEASYNTAVGNYALVSSLGERNTSIGSNSLENDSTGSSNTAIGYGAGFSIKTGNNNTFVGHGTNASSENLYNATSLGNNAIVNASNKVRIGDVNVSVIEGQVAWSNPSDRRLKESIVYTSRLGLDFINGLKTVSYNYIADKNKTRYDGFIAQDIEKLMTDLNIPFSGLKKSDDGMLSLAYSDFVMPLVNAIQEQQKEIESLKEELSKTEGILERLEKLEAMITNL